MLTKVFDLRKANIRLPIMIMNIDEDAFEPVIQYNLEPEIYSVNIFKALMPFLISKVCSYTPYT
jgi:alanine racemase